MANTKIPVELSSTPGIVDNSNATAITIDSSENVGIGTDSPDKALTISASDSQIRLYDADGTNQFASFQSDNGITKITSRNNTSHGQIAFQRYNGTTVVETMRIDSSGNVGIGTSSPATQFHLVNSDDAVARIESSGSESGDDARLEIKTTNGTFTIQNDRSLGTSGALTFAGNTSNNLVIDHNSGNVGIGDSSPAAKLEIKQGSSNWYEGIRINRSDNATQFSTFSNNSGASFIGAVDTTGGDNNAIVFGTSTNGTTFTERMRIDSSGNLLVGTTQTPATLLSDGHEGVGIGNNGYIVSTRFNDIAAYFKRENSNGNVVSFLRDATSVGTISVTTSATAYNTSSDARLKDVTGQARGLDVINALNPVSYNWKADGKADEGLIAQEVLDIVPNAVSGSEEEMYQMDYSKLVVHLVAGMKEQQTQIEALQSEINELKNS